ncbi:small integral membrane protein 24 [Corvus cornix cornix]|uniref:small integral membrane protein 24 n=2 Tax=Corvus TaxID=30420 RepID=UPI00194ED4AB|nr:small integral membrane protein 24 [Corvus cornix cornix]
MVLGATCPLGANKGARCPGCGEQGSTAAGDRSSLSGAGSSRALALHSKMPRPLQPLSLLVLLVLTATAQGQADTGPKVLQPWLIGLTAVVVFLFIVFVMLLVNRLWNLRRRRKENDYPETLATDRLGRSGHVNPAAEDWDELSDDKQRSKATSF